LIAEQGVSPGARVLDYGCADQPYRSCFPATAEYVGADLPGNPVAALEIGPDAGLPVDDESFDLVLSTQVLEHVENPSHYLAESSRVLRSGGRLVLSTHGMMFFHPDPVDLWRWTCQGLRRAVGDAGLEVMHFEGIMGLAATGLQFVQDALLVRMPARAHAPFAYVMQALVALADRFESQERRNLNALVFAVVATKP
jgi:SAM-dependent methyltransferase